MQLKEAKTLMDKNDVKEAVFIYSYLAKQSVPEAMYLYGNLAIQQKHMDLNCKEGLEWITKAADRGYAPAKRTLGFLYVFADNQQLLEMNDYSGCTYQRNVFKGAKLLAQAVTAGDSTAAKILRQIKLPVTEVAQ
jgi:serine/threonine-protein kinase